MVRHEGQREGAGKGDERRKLSRKEIDQGDGEGSEDQGDDSEVSLRFGERVKLVGENEEERRMKIGWILSIEFYLVFQIIARVIKSVDFIYPERFLIKGVEP